LVDQLEKFFSAHGGIARLGLRRPLLTIYS